MKVFKLLFILVALFFATNNFASDFEELKKKAEQGDARSQLRLGITYMQGKEVEENNDEATKWIRLAAENGELPAQYYYGAFLSSPLEGFKWISKAAEGGYVDAQLLLGDLYKEEDSEYVEKDIDKSLFWLTKVSEKNDYISVGASFRLYLMYEYGDNVNKDKQLASEWLKNALNANEFDAKHIYEASEGRNDIDAFMYLMLAAEMGYSEAQNKLGKVYIYGKKYFNSLLTSKIVIPADGKKAIKWLKRAAKNGLADANYQLGYIYLNGVFNLNKNKDYMYEIKPNRTRFINYYKLAASKNHVKAQEELNRRNTFKSDPWSKYDTARSWYFNYLLEYTWFKSSVAFSKAGEKKIYFSISEEKDICDPAEYDNGYGSSVWEINNQAISMTTFCKKDNKDFYIISATPTTKEGSDFIVNTFMKHTGDVQVEGSGYNFPVSANGFTKVWNNKSANAL